MDAQILKIKKNGVFCGTSKSAISLEKGAF